MKNTVFWDVIVCGCCKNRRFEDKLPPSSGGKISELAANLAVTSNLSTLRSVYGSVTLMMEAISSSETLVLRIATRRHISEDDILHSHRRENFKSLIALTGWAL
jgi:hypothetical protein